jgi:hypothetical protein
MTAGTGGASTSAPCQLIATIIRSMTTFGSCMKFFCAAEFNFAAPSRHKQGCWKHINHRGLGACGPTSCYAPYVFSTSGITLSFC